MSELKKQLGAVEERGRVERKNLITDLNDVTSTKTPVRKSVKDVIFASEERAKIEVEIKTRPAVDVSRLTLPKPNSTSLILEEAVYGQLTRTTDKTERVNPDEKVRRPIGTVKLAGAAGGKLVPKNMQKNPLTFSRLLKSFAECVVGAKTIAIAGQAAGYIADTLVARTLAKGLGACMSALDVLTIAQMFSDAGFYNQFPDESDLLTWDNVQQYIVYSLNTQLQVLQTYNAGITITNTQMDSAANARDDGYPYAPALFPMINGPLDIVDMNVPGQFQGDTYYNNVRIHTEIDAVQEKLLRDVTTVYGAALENAFNSQAPCGQSWSAVTSDQTQSLISYLSLSTPCTANPPSSLLPVQMIDNLYSEAYTAVCSNYGGVVYKDYYPKSDKYRPGRQRLQCGYANPQDCNQNAVSYYKDYMSGVSHGGSYAEWHTFSDILTNTGVMPSSLTTLSAQLSVINATTPQDYSNASVLVTLAANSFATYTKAGYTGACIVKNPALFSLCATPLQDPTSEKTFAQNTTNPYTYDPGTNTTTLPSGGTYNFTTHTCQFSPSYCQLIGTCYGIDTGLCALPGKTMEALSFFFGVGGPRAFIKSNGCTYRGPTCTAVNGLNFATADGGSFVDSLVTTHKEWGPGLKAEFTNPTNDLMFIMSLATIVMTTAPTWAVSTGIPGTSWIVDSSVGSFFQLEGVVAPEITAEIATEEAALSVAETTGEIAAETAATGNLSVAFALGLIAMSAAIATGMIAIFQTANTNWDQRSAPITDPNEYTTGGWFYDQNNNKAAKTVSLASGWVTKPILFHPPGQPTTPYSSVDAFPSSLLRKNSEFATQRQGDDLRSFLSTCCNGGCTPGTAWFDTCPKQFSCNADVGGYVRAGSDNHGNVIWCLKPYPIVSTDTDVHDPNIGPLSTQTSNYLWSNVWTDGSISSLPLFPQNYNAPGNQHHGWYYQLSYDRDKILPSAVNNTTLLQKYFDDTTIGQIKSYYCINKFYTDVGNGSVTNLEPWCWGYLNVSTTNYVFNPMTLAGSLNI